MCLSLWPCLLASGIQNFSKDALKQTPEKPASSGPNISAGGGGGGGGGGGARPSPGAGPAGFGMIDLGQVKLRKTGAPGAHAPQLRARSASRTSFRRANVKVDFWGIENKWGKTLGANLHSIQFFRDDEPLVGGRMSFDTAIDGFEDVDVDAAFTEDDADDDFLK